MKFNPNHDPANGQFTFAGGAGGARPSKPPRRNQGRESWGDGIFHGGGGGTSGGGGASGTWSDPQESPSQAGEEAIVRADEALAREAAADRPDANSPVNVTKNGYHFLVDTSDRTRHVEGDLSLEDAARSRANQRQAGGVDRRDTDDGGHFIAARFNGPNDSFNHFAQDANFNRGAYRALEDAWAKSLRSGANVSVDILAHYPNASKRPDSLNVTWRSGGITQRKIFPNSSRGK
ncbi:DNA/RNA non-specific endonuclease [uncultured Sphingomonas sp.]|uniref:DNA/RNA non-specific endonuclease n=1 Tax=uncultured Sphingomonas sp. TaxID=158754 RepID=UPI0035C9F870